MEEDIINNILNKFNLDLSDAKEVTETLQILHETTENEEINSILDNQKQWLYLITQLGNVKERLIWMEKWIVRKLLKEGKLFIKIKRNIINNAGYEIRYRPNRR
jgi:hypothetical protein